MRAGRRKEFEPVDVVPHLLLATVVSGQRRWAATSWAGSRKSIGNKLNKSLCPGPWPWLPGAWIRPCQWWQCYPTLLPSLESPSPPMSVYHVHCCCSVCCHPLGGAWPWGRRGRESRGFSLLSLSCCTEVFRCRLSSAALVFWLLTRAERGLAPGRCFVLRC
jgi:hypothetical protein